MRQSSPPYSNAVGAAAQRMAAAPCVQQIQGLGERLARLRDAENFTVELHVHWRAVSCLRLVYFWILPSLPLFLPDTKLYERVARHALFFLLQIPYRQLYDSVYVDAPIFFCPPLHLPYFPSTPFVCLHAALIFLLSLLFCSRSHIASAYIIACISAFFSKAHPPQLLNYFLPSIARLDQTFQIYLQHGYSHRWGEAVNTASGNSPKYTKFPTQ